MFFAVAAPVAPGAAAELRLSGRTLPEGGEFIVEFRLARAATDGFSITQIAPVRRTVAAFEVRGRAGANRFVFPGRIDRRLLRPGTYRLAAEIEGARAVSPPFRVVEQEQPRQGESRALRTLVVLCLLLAIPLLGVAAPGQSRAGRARRRVARDGTIWPRRLHRAGRRLRAVHRKRPVTLDVCAGRPTV